MKRPLMTTGFSLFVSLAVFSSFRVNALISIAIVFAIITLTLFVVLRKHKLLSVVFVFLGSLLASILLVSADYLYMKPAEEFDGKYIEAEGYVTRIDNSGYILKCKISDEFYNIYVIDYSTEDVYYGDKYKITANVQHTNELESDYIRARCRAHNCALFCEEPTVIYSNDIVAEYPLEEKFFQLKNYLLDVQQDVFSDFSVGFINTITLGERRAVSSDIRLSFQRAGLSHVLVISGLHLSIISGIVYTFLRKFGRRKAAFVSIFAVLFYMMLTGFEPSITRAGIMNIVMYCAIVFREDYDGLTSIGVACLVMCLLNPYCAADISLQLSVVSTTGILLFLPPARKFIWNILGESTFFKRILMWFFDVIIISLSANFALMPFYVFVFGTVSVIAPLTNIVSSLLMPFIVANSLFATLLAIIPIVAPVACVPAFLADISSYALIRSTQWFSDFKYASVSTEYTFMIIWIVASTAMFAYAFYKNKTKIKFHALLLSIIVLFASIFCYNITNGSKTSVKIAPTYSNGCITLKQGGHTTVICSLDGEDKWHTLKNALSDAGVYEIDLLIVPQYDNDSKLIALLNEYKTKKLVIDFDSVDSTDNRKFNEYGVEAISISANREIEIGDRVTVKFLPQKDATSVMFDVDGVLFCSNYGEIDMLESFDFHKETDVLLLGSSLPYGVSHMDLSYVVFTNYKTEETMYKNTAYLTNKFAFCDNPITFMVEDGTFYTSNEWGKGR